MIGIYDNLENLIVALNTGAADKTTSIMILENLILDLINNNVPLDQRMSANTIVEKYKTRVEAGNLKYASGFFGHWAKSIEENNDENY